MQIKKKIVKMMALILLLTVAVGCGEAKTPPEAPNEPEVIAISPEAAALLYCNAAVKANFKEAEKIGLTKEMQASLTEAHQERLRQGALAIWKSWGVRDIAAAERDTEFIDNFPEGVKTVKSMNYYMEGLKAVNDRIELKTALVSQENHNAIIRIAVRTIDGNRFYHSLVEPLLRSIAFTRITDDLERAKFITRVFRGSAQRAELLEEPISFETPFVFDEESGYWQPANDAFGEKLAQAAIW